MPQMQSLSQSGTQCARKRIKRPGEKFVRGTDDQLNFGAKAVKAYPKGHRIAVKKLKLALSH
jgi:hypothetical protein